MVELAVKDGVAWLTLRRPQALNALNREMIESFRGHVLALKERADVRVVVTCGEGRSFCAGSDLRELALLSSGEAAGHERRTAEVCALLDELPQPTIAMLHGHVLGGGLGLALYHDFRIAADSAKLGMPEVELGWTPPWAVGRLVEAVGFSKARWLMMTSTVVGGSEAALQHLVTEAIPEPDLRHRAEKFAQRLAAMSSDGLAQTKALLHRMSPLRRAEWDAEAASAFELCYAKPEAQRRVAEFTQRRSKS